jgi:hypothetical protein
VDKRASFEAVFCETSQEVQARVEAAARAGETALERLLLRSRAYLAPASDHQLVRIDLVSGPTVLGWGRWREIDAQHSLRSLRRGLAKWLEMDDEALALGMSGAFNELALALAEPRMRLSLSTACGALERLILGLGADPARSPRLCLTDAMYDVGLVARR